MPIVTLLTDFGGADYYVGAVKGVLLSGAPGATLVDLSHEVPPGDIETAAFLLAAAARWYPPGTIHLVVVDPGVGGDRRILAVRRGTAAFVAPDNGVLEGILGGADVRSVEDEQLFLPGPGDTFHGRDRFAPVAARLAAGGAIEELGPAVDDPVRLDLPAPRLEPAGARGRVAHVDRFGNLVTDLPCEWLEGRPTATVRVAGREIERRARHYAEVPAGEPFWLRGSLGTVELSLRGDSLSARWGIDRGEPVEAAFR